jgi:cell division protein FtsB
MPVPQKNLFQRFFASKIFIVVSGFLFLFFAFAYVRASYQNYQIREEIKRLQNETETLKAKKFQTLELLKYAQSPAYVEEKARTELNLMRDGEHVAIIDGNDVNEHNGQVSESMLKSNSINSNPLMWWNYFFNH